MKRFVKSFIALMLVFMTLVSCLPLSLKRGVIYFATLKENFERYHANLSSSEEYI